MKNATLILLTSLALVGLCRSAAAQGAPPTPDSTWRTFTSAEGAFSVELPGQPTDRVLTGEQAAGALSVHVLRLVVNENGYVITYLDTMRKDEPADKYLGRWVGDFTRNQKKMGVTEISLRSVTSSFDCPAIEWQSASVEFPSMRMIFFETPRRSYAVSFLSSQIGEAQRGNAERFFRSFKSTDAPCHWTGTTEPSAAQSSGVGGGVGPGEPPLSPDLPGKIPYGDPKSSGDTIDGGPDAPVEPKDYSRVFRVKEVTRKAVIIEKPKPVFTEAARQHDVTGEVVLRLVLGSNGQVTGIQPIKRLPDGLTEEAIAAAKLVQFQPAELDGRKVSQYVTIAYTFNSYYKEDEVTRKVEMLVWPTPDYTPEARAQRITGKVVLRAIMSKRGTVDDLSVVSGLPYGLTERALEAARQIKFRPAELDGKAVSQVTILEYAFTLP